LGRGTRWGLARATVGPLAPAQALTTLEDLVGLYREGLREPLPLPIAGAHTYAKVVSGGGSTADATEEAMRGWALERSDDAHLRVWGATAPAEVITGSPGPPGGEPSRFGALAMRLWSPLLISEELVRR
jgi:exodeoxyribonuclease V gamma subunit